MADDKTPTDWRDKVKSPSEKNERFIGGKSSTPEKDGKKVHWQKLDEEKTYDKDSHGKKLEEASARKEERAVKPYVNRKTQAEKPVKTPTSKGSSLKGLGNQIAEGIEEIADKATPYLDDAAKVAGEVGKAGLKLSGRALGPLSILYPESTATDEEMSLNKLDKENAIYPQRKEPANAESKINKVPESKFEKLTDVEQDRAFDLIAEKEKEEADFLKRLPPLEPERDLEFDYWDLNFPDVTEDGDIGDAGDGADGGGDGGGE